MSQASVERVAQMLQDLLGPVAHRLGFETKFIQRRRQLTPEAFVQGITLAWLHNPDSTLEQLAQSVTAAGSPIAPQSLDERFTESAALFLEQVLLHVSTLLIQAKPAQQGIFDRFSAVHLHDSSTIALPRELSSVWRACDQRLYQFAYSSNFS